MNNLEKEGMLYTRFGVIIGLVTLVMSLLKGYYSYMFIFLFITSETAVIIGFILMMGHGMMVQTGRINEKIEGLKRENG